MRISIVTVVYNNPQVKEALDSILAQRVDAEVEIIVIDGGSRDGTLEVLQAYRDRIAVLVSEPDRGIYDAMNKGLALATGDFVGTLNSDDMFYDEHSLAAILEGFGTPGVSVVYGDLVMVSGKDPARVLRVWKSVPFRPGLLERGWMPPHPTFYARRQAYLDYGSFDLGYRTAADFDLMARFLGRHGLRSLHLPRYLVRMRLGGASNGSLRAILHANLEAYRACARNGLRPSKGFIPMKLMRKVLQYFVRAPRVPGPGQPA